jgi:hypothetical protein
MNSNVHADRALCGSHALPFHKKLQSTALQGAGKQGKNDVH